jgi:hypothetical protein
MSTDALDEETRMASDSDSDASTSEVDSASNSDTEEEVTPEYLQSLLDTARRNVREEARRVAMLREEKETDGFGEQDIVKIGDGEEKYV